VSHFFALTIHDVEVLDKTFFAWHSWLFTVSFIDLNDNNVVGFAVSALQSHILSAMMVQIKSLDHPLLVASIEVTKISIDQFNACPLRNVWFLPLEATIYTVLDSSEGNEVTLLE
jgi:hypothetical protein